MLGIRGFARLLSNVIPSLLYYAIKGHIKKNKLEFQCLHYELSPFQIYPCKFTLINGFKLARMNVNYWERIW